MIRNILALVGALAIGFGTVGWYMNWYTFNYQRTSDGTLKLGADVNTKRVVDDGGNLIQKAGTFIEDKTSQNAQAAQPTPTPAPAAPTPPAAPAAPQTPTGWPFHMKPAG